MRTKEYFYRLSKEAAQNGRDRRKANLTKARAMKRTPSTGAQRESDNAQIADYLSRNPHPKVW